MEKLVFTTGMVEYALENGAILRFNPRDPSVIEGFLSLEEKICDLHPQGENNLEKWADADTRCRELLTQVFPGNDFQQILGPGNSLALCENGVSTLGNFLDAVEPILEHGVKVLMEEAIQKAKERRGE